MFKAYYKSPVGTVEIVTDHDSILEVSFVDSDIDSSGQDLPQILKDALIQIDEYFKGQRQNFDLKLNAKGTVFQQSVWQKLIEVPFGTTSTYGELAKVIGNEKASRAVGGANNKNKIGIIIPCHRIVGASGKLVGYAGGLWRKEWLLNHEKQNSGK